MQTEHKYLIRFLRKSQITTRETVNIVVIEIIHMLSLFLKIFFHYIEQVKQVNIVKFYKRVLLIVTTNILPYVQLLIIVNHIKYVWKE